MIIYIDTNTFSASPMLYADEEKTKPLPRIIPAVQLTEGNLQIGFLGDNTPLEGSTLSLSAVLPSRTQILASDGDFIDGASVPTWEFSVALNSAELAETLESRGSVTLSFGVIATATGYRQEWQFLSVCTPTATGELDTEQVESAKDYAEQSRQSAQSAEQSKQAAETSASNAQTSATNAATSAGNAATSASNASASASNAATSATNAAGSASAASTSATNAGNSATDAATSADEVELMLGTFRNEKATLETNIATNTANIDWLKLAVENDWKIFMLLKAQQTGVKQYIDLAVRVAKEHTADPDNSVLGGRMAEDWELLFRSDAWTIAQGGESPWTVEFWKAYFEECIRWEKNPDETLDWSAASGNNPYKDVAPTKPVVNFSVTNIAGTTTKSSFSTDFGVPFYFPNCTDYCCAFYENQKLENVVISSKQSINFLMTFMSSEVKTANISCTSFVRGMSMFQSTPVVSARINQDSGALDLSNIFTGSSKVEYIAIALSGRTTLPTFSNYGIGAALKTLIYIGGLPVCTTMNNVAQRALSSLTHICFDEYDTETVKPLNFPVMTTLNASFSGWTIFNQPHSFPVLSSGVDAYLNAGMSAENIAYVLNSLPAHTDGASHVITFTGCPGAAELTQESESVAAATARGWTVEL